MNRLGRYSITKLHHELSLFFFIFCLVFQDRVSLCKLSCCSETRYVDQADLEFAETCLPLPPECWIKGLRHRLAVL